MRGILWTTVVLLLCAGSAWADEKDGKTGTPGGPPPGKGWRKNETPAPAVPTPAPTPKQKGVTPVPPPAKPPVTPPTAKKPDDGIGQTVSKWARSGIHGRELAAKIHQLQAARAKTTSPTPPPTAKPEKKGKPEVTPTPPPTPKKKGKPGGEDD